jgi:protease-4
MNRTALSLAGLLAITLPLGAGAGLPTIDTSGIEQEPTPPPRVQRWVLMDLSETYPERRDPFNLFEPQSTNFRDLLDSIAKAKDDEEVTGLVIDVQSPGLGLSQIQTLRRAIQDFRAANKQAVAYLTEAEPRDYLLATACDEIAMAPEGVLTLNGVQLNGIFLRGLLDLLGIQPDIIQIGQYKGTGDMFTDRAFTPALREALTSLVDDLYGQVVNTVAEGRHLDRALVERLIDQGLFTAQAAVNAGLVDQLAQPSDFVTDLQISAGDGFVLDDTYGEKEAAPLETNIFNILAMFQQAAAPAQESRNPKIALLYATGPIVVTSPDDSPFADTNIISSDDFTDLLHTCRDDETVRAVVVRVDSPGGSALASDIIWNELRELGRTKPVVVSMGDVAASGGYYIAMGGTEIYAEPGTLTGSIGVVGGKFVLTGLLEGHLGITHDTISRGQNAGLYSLLTPFSDGEREAVTTVMQDIYEAFTSKAAESRGMTPEQIEAVAQGRIWTGQQAVENHLVDHIGGLGEALARAEELANLTDDERKALEIRELPPPQNFVEWLAKNMGGQAMIRALPPELAAVIPAQDLSLLRQVSLWRGMFQQDQVLALMPVMLTVR